MKAVCPHCQNVMTVNPVKRLRDVSCPACCPGGTAKHFAFNE